MNFQTPWDTILFNLLEGWNFNGIFFLIKPNHSAGWEPRGKAFKTSIIRTNFDYYLKPQRWSNLLSLTSPPNEIFENHHQLQKIGKYFSHKSSVKYFLKNSRIIKILIENIVNRKWIIFFSSLENHFWKVTRQYHEYSIRAPLFNLKNSCQSMGSN